MLGKGTNSCSTSDACCVTVKRHERTSSDMEIVLDTTSSGNIVTNLYSSRTMRSFDFLVYYSGFFSQLIKKCNFS